MGKHSRCAIDICDNDIQYLELHKKHCNVDRDIIMYKLPKDGAVKAAWGSPSAKCLSSPSPIYHKQTKLIQIQ